MKINLVNEVYGTNQTDIINIGMPTIFVELSNSSTGISYKETELAEMAFAIATNKFGSEHGLYHPRTSQQIQFCFTGADPMAKQNFISSTISELDNLDDFNCYPILIESSGTIPIEFPLKRFIYYTDHIYNFSCTIPICDKKCTIDTNVLENYADNSTSGCIKLIVDGTTNCWDRVDEHTDDLYEVLDVNPNWSLWIVPKPHLIEHKGDQLMNDIIDETLRRGYNILSNGY